MGKHQSGEAVYRGTHLMISGIVLLKFISVEILPETEVFDIGMIHNMKLVEKERRHLPSETV